MSKLPVFITGNMDKVKYLSETLGVLLEHHKLSLDEIQSANPQEVIEHKVRQAYDILQQPVLVEDTSLSFNALGGLPGPFVKFFVEAENGQENMCRMLDSFSDRSAYVCVTYGYYDGENLTFFVGRLNGVIAQLPRGTGGYGWDAIFEPTGSEGRTNAELTPEEYIRIFYDYARDTDGLRTFLQSL
jgi:inosine triphosphate pyrophosphatase